MESLLQQACNVLRSYGCAADNDFWTIASSVGPVVLLLSNKKQKYTIDVERKLWLSNNLCIDGEVIIIPSSSNDQPLCANSQVNRLHYNDDLLPSSPPSSLFSAVNKNLSTLVVSTLLRQEYRIDLQNCLLRKQQGGMAMTVFRYRGKTYYRHEATLTTDGRYRGIGRYSAAYFGSAFTYREIYHFFYPSREQAPYLVRIEYLDDPEAIPSNTAFSLPSLSSAAIDKALCDENGVSHNIYLTFLADKKYLTFRLSTLQSYRSRYLTIKQEDTDPLLTYCLFLSAYLNHRLPPETYSQIGVLCPLLEFPPVDLERLSTYIFKEFLAPLTPLTLLSIINKLNSQRSPSDPVTVKDTASTLYLNLLANSNLQTRKKVLALRYQFAEAYSRVICYGACFTRYLLGQLPGNFWSNVDVLSSLPPEVRGSYYREKRSPDLTLANVLSPIPEKVRSFFLRLAKNSCSQTTPGTNLCQYWEKVVNEANPYEILMVDRAFLTLRC